MHIYNLNNETIKKQTKVETRLNLIKGRAQFHNSGLKTIFADKFDFDGLLILENESFSSSDINKTTKEIISKRF